MLSVAYKTIMMCGVMLRVVMLRKPFANIVMLCVVMLSVVAPLFLTPRENKIWYNSFPKSNALAYSKCGLYQKI